jgi:hypothetical protein
MIETAFGQNLGNLEFLRQWYRFLSIGMGGHHSYCQNEANAAENTRPGCTFFSPSPIWMFLAVFAVYR